MADLPIKASGPNLSLIQVAREKGVSNRMVRLLILGLILTARLAHSLEALDQAAVHKEYEDGDFEGVLQKIDAFQKNNPDHSSSDSLFIAKHLAVVYAANPKTVEIGKYWMYQLLKLMPAANLAGMYVNEEIDRIFDKVRQEFLARQHAFGVDTTKIVLPPRTEPTRKASVDSSTGAKSAAAPETLAKSNASAPDGSNSQLKVGKNRRNKWLWLGTGGTAMVALVTAYIVMSTESDSNPTQTKVPVDL